MPIHKLKLLAKKTIANNTVLFQFEKPAGFNFVPGQYGGFTLINPTETDAGGITRRFSILSTPQDNSLDIAMRIQKSAYKRVLNNLALESEIKFAGPSGNFTLPDDATRPVVLIAGGIGITPFYCMINDATQKNSTRKIYLFYGNRTPQDAPLLKELQLLEQQNPNFKLICTMEASDQAWQGEVGYITHSLIKKYISDESMPIYYVCGSSFMVTALQETLLEMGVDAERIKVEDFPGY